MNRPLTTLFIIASLSASTALAQEPQADATDMDTELTIPEGVVPTPAQTHNPKILGFGMLIVGVAMGFILFGRGAKSTEQPGDDTQ